MLRKLSTRGPAAGLPESQGRIGFISDGHTAKLESEVEQMMERAARDKFEIEDLRKKYKTMEKENKQLKEVAQMIDSMITFAQGNDQLIQKKKDLQKKKNKLRMEIQRQLTSLNELNSKVNPADGSFDLYVNNSTGGLSPKSNRAGIPRQNQMQEEE